MMITNFAAGELGPTLNGRTDIQQYFQGSSYLSNFDVIPTGGLERRKGTQRVGELASRCRLIPFILDKNISFVLEVAPDVTGSKINIWRNDQKIEEQVIKAPWNSLDEINEIQYAQNYNTMIFVQKDHPPFQIIYNEGVNTFTYGTINFNFTPKVKLDDDYDYIKIVQELPASKVADYIIYNGHLYKWNGETWEIEQESDEFVTDTELFNKAGKYPGAVAFFNGRLYLAATRSNQQKVWASATPDLEGTRYNDFSTYVKYVTVNKILKDPDVHFFTGDATELSDTLVNITQDLTQISNLTDYYVTGDNIKEGTKAVSATWNSEKNTGTLKLTNPVLKAATVKMFSIQKWINRLEASAADYEYKIENNNMTSPDNSFYFELASDQNDGIKWLANASNLIIGTESATYVMNAQSNAAMQNVVMNGRYGTDDIQATVVDNAVIFFAQGKKGIREYYWNQEVNGFRSNNLALLAPQMLMESAAVDFDFMTNPYSRLVITRADGTLVMLLYDKNIGVQAWNRVKLGTGQIKSVAVIRGEGGSDIVYMEVEHAGKYYLEKLDYESDVYLDSWERYTAATDPAAYPGAVLYNVTTNEIITEIPEIFVESSDIIYIGYKYESRVISMPIVNNDVTGKKRITSLIVRFYNAYMPKLIVGDKKEIFTDVAEPYSGLKQIVYPGESQRDVTFTLGINEPQECNILAINAKLE